MSWTSKTLRIAGREFASTALTKGFIFGAIVVPALFAVIVPLIIFLINQAKPPAEQGTLVVIDRSGQVTETLTGRLDIDDMLERRRSQVEEIAQAAEERLPDVGGIREQAGDSIRRTTAEQLGVPEITVEAVSDGPIEDDAFEALIAEQQERMRAQVEPGPARVIGVAVIDADAVVEGEGSEDLGGFQLFVRPKLDARTLSEMRDAIRWSIREERYARAGLDRASLERLSRVTARETQEVTDKGVTDSSAVLNQILPFIMMGLLFMGVMTGGQYLLTTVVEEKSSRVVEVLLSAVSPMQLMTGKILGQMLVGMVLLGLYMGVGIFALVMFSVTQILDPMVVVAMVVFFILAYLMIASLMAAIGAAVNEMREAQSLMTPVMLVLVVSFYLAFPVSQDPTALYARVLSFIPPVSPFVMLTRIASTEPPPMWEVLASMAVSAIGAFVFLKLAAKIFRVGLLMYGKPPNFTTLIKWVRMA